MTIERDTKIRVYNYADKLFFAGEDMTYIFEASDGEITYDITMPFYEIKRMNVKSDVFKIKRLMFDKDMEDEIYKELGIKNHEEILSDNDIERIILNPTVEGVEKILAIRDINAFERVTRALVGLQSLGRYDISTRLTDLITYRRDEILSGKYKTEMDAKAFEKVENKTIDIDAVVAEKTKTLEEEIAELKKQLSTQKAQNTKLKKQVDAK